MFAAHKKLDNLVAIIDRSQLQIDGHTCDVCDPGDLGAKLAAFGWDADNPFLFMPITTIFDNNNNLYFCDVAALLSGYPILMGPFFVCLGLFQSFQMAREANDTMYTVLLPIKKADAVAAKYRVVCFFELISLALMAVCTVIRMTVLGHSIVYEKNALMNATPVFLAFASTCDVGI